LTTAVAAMLPVSSPGATKTRLPSRVTTSTTLKSNVSGTSLLFMIVSVCVVPAPGTPLSCNTAGVSVTDGASDRSSAAVTENASAPIASATAAHLQGKFTPLQFLVDGDREID